MAYAVFTTFLRRLEASVTFWYQRKGAVKDEARGGGQALVELQQFTVSEKTYETYC